MRLLYDFAEGCGNRPCGQKRGESDLTEQALFWAWVVND